MQGRRQKMKGSQMHCASAIQNGRYRARRPEHESWCSQEESWVLQLRAGWRHSQRRAAAVPGAGGSHGQWSLQAAWFQVEYKVPESPQGKESRTATTARCKLANALSLHTLISVGWQQTLASNLRSNIIYRWASIRDLLLLTSSSVLAWPVLELQATSASLCLMALDGLFLH